MCAHHGFCCRDATLIDLSNLTNNISCCSARAPLNEPSTGAFGIGVWALTCLVSTMNALVPLVKSARDCISVQRNAINAALTAAR